AFTELVSSLKYAAYARDNNLFLVLASLHVMLAPELGYHPSTPVAISDLALGVSGRLGKVDDAARMLDLARELARAEPTAIAEARVLSIGAVMSFHRSRPFAEVVALLEPGYQRALEVGEFGPASFIA